VTPRWGAEREKRQRFLVEEIEPSQTEKGPMTPYMFTLGSSIVYKNLTSRPESTPEIGNGNLEFDFDGLIGMDRSLEELRCCLPTTERLFQGERTVPILLHGSARVGKTTVLQRIKSSNWARVFVIDELTTGGTDAKIRLRLKELFKEAMGSTPSLITIDNLHRIAPKGDGSVFAWDLSELIEQSKFKGVQVVATARRVRDVQTDLRRAFEENIELPLPKREARLQMLTHMAQSCDSVVLSRTADKAHAFSAHDLFLLWSKAVRISEARHRRERNHPGQPKTVVSDDSGPPGPALLEEDFEEALRFVHPESMNEIYVEIPKVYWSDIGGSATTKAYLQDIVEAMGKVRFLFEIATILI
jgi:AAA family ATPase